MFNLYPDITSYRCSSRILHCSQGSIHRGFFNMPYAMTQDIGFRGLFPKPECLYWKKNSHYLYSSLGQTQPGFSLTSHIRSEHCTNWASSFNAFIRIQTWCKVRCQIRRSIKKFWGPVSMCKTFGDQLVCVLLGSNHCEMLTYKRKVILLYHLHIKVCSMFLICTRHILIALCWCQTTKLSSNVPHVKLFSMISISIPNSIL